ncbi:hypothetical protein ASD16_14865 [Cellulomonas sp. Root485]|uniref:DUF5134 domain-containing protein n=1 Tax=Cellulomonas sp. Root485 TaxID=1736546 RepID=UPI0006F5E900|nr:DUF5134 domain-containing protein [Cellulomonas sp. Root485]KQY21944.1 hypothetical protein ASD16_14865 [Cellulomonas sp. Root485]
MPTASVVTVALLVSTGITFALGVVGCSRRTARRWAGHSAMGFAMVAMVVPSRDPLGPAAWAVVLGCVLLWTTVAALQERAAEDVPGPSAFESAREVVELGLMVVLVLVMPAVHGRSVALPGGHHGESAGDVRTLVLTVLVGWLTAAVALHARAASAGSRHGHRTPAAVGGSVAAVGTMAAMVAM